MDVATRSLRSGQVYLTAAALALSTVTIGGCAPTNSAHQVEAVSKAALPDQALLRRQPEPECAFRGPVSDPMTAEETRQKLDYEQQCYRAFERIVRARLAQLQDSVQKMTKMIASSFPQLGWSAPQVAPEAATAAIEAGGFVVQVSAERSEPEARATFGEMQAKYSVLNSRRLLIRRKDQGERGIFYAAQVGPFGVKSDADQLCATLKSAGGTCFIQKN
jgi:cell division septation protein DedD